MILRQALAVGAPIPKKMAEAPVLRPGLELYYMAFFDLVTTRGGMGDGPIPWTAVAEYARVYGLDQEQLEQLAFYIGKMDEVFIAHLRSKRPKPAAGRT